MTATEANESHIMAMARLRRLVRSGEARRIRERAQVRQREVAEELGVSIPTVFKWEEGRRGPNNQHAVPYLRLLDALAALEES